MYLSGFFYITFATDLWPRSIFINPPKYIIMEEKVFNKLEQIEKLIRSSGSRVIKLPDVSAITGLANSTIYRKTCSNSIPYYKNDDGKSLFFDREEIEKWCLKHRHATKEEVEGQAVNYVAIGTPLQPSVKASNKGQVAAPIGMLTGKHGKAANRHAAKDEVKEQMTTCCLTKEKGGML